MIFCRFVGSVNILLIWSPISADFCRFCADLCEFVQNRGFGTNKIPNSINLCLFSKNMSFLLPSVRLYTIQFFFVPSMCQNHRQQETAPSACPNPCFATQTRLHPTWCASPSQVWTIPSILCFYPPPS